MGWSQSAGLQVPKTGGEVVVALNAATRSVQSLTASPGWPDWGTTTVAEGEKEGVGPPVGKAGLIAVSPLGGSERMLGKTYG